MDMQQKIKLLEMYANMDNDIARDYLKDLMNAPAIDEQPKPRKHHAPKAA
jgi:predicted transcriptional regulator